MKHNAGFTLIELMVTVAVLGVLMVIAVPAYRNYVDTAEEGVLVSNIHTIEMFQEDFFLRNGNYSVGHANVAAITAAIGWEPRTDDGSLYQIDGDGVASYTVTGTNSLGRSVCIVFPDKTRCP